MLMTRAIVLLTTLGLGSGLAACDKSDPKPAEPAKVTPPSDPAAATPAPAPAPAEPAKTAPAKVAPSTPAPAKARLGDPAPDFTLTGVDGASFTLSAQRGKLVVLEWFNPGCPFVKYAYNDGPLKDQARNTVTDDVLWVNVNSGAPGKQGHGVQANSDAIAKWQIPGPVLLDEDGTVGRLYQARTTPQLYIVAPSGALVYRGAIDNAPLGNAKGDVVNFVASALADLAAGKPITTPETEPYGCSVKYASK